MSQLNVVRVKKLLCMLYDDMKELSDDGRDIPIVWNVMHMFSSSQVAKIIALRRGVNMELASIAATLHDIAVIVTKKTKNHAEIAERYVRAAIERFNNESSTSISKITDEEINMIVNAIIRHSDKETYSNDPFIELLKDIDSVDRYLHGIESDGAYLERCNRVFMELGIKEIAVKIAENSEQ